MVSRASPMPEPQMPTPWRAWWGRAMGDAGGQGGSQRRGTSRVGRHWKSLTKVGKAQVGFEGLEQAEWVQAPS